MADVQRGVPIEESVLVHYLQQAQTNADPNAFDGLYLLYAKDNVSIFSAWLYRLAHNKMVDILRKQKRTKHVAIENAFGLASNENITEEVSVKIEAEHVIDQLQYLNEQQRQVIVLRFLEGYSVAETAQVMQKSEGAIKALQHRSLNSLRRHLQN